MSSRIHYDGNHDPILRYAPPRVRAQAQQPPESASAPVERPPPSQAANSIEFSGDRAIVEMRQRLALEPEWVPEPPQDAAPGRDLWTLALYASDVLGVAALLAWVVVSVPDITQLGSYVVRAAFPGMLASTNSRTSGLPSGASSSVASSSVATKAAPQPPNWTVTTTEPLALQVKERTDPREQPAPAPPYLGAANSQPPTDRQTSPAEQALPAPTSEATMAEQRSAPDFVVTRKLDPDELASMIRRADDFIKSGDLSSARLLLRRAAESGSERAALTLAGTFDPNVLAALGLQDGAADIAMARFWYKRAEQFGSSEAPRRLRELAANSVQ